MEVNYYREQLIFFTYILIGAQDCAEDFLQHVRTLAKSGYTLWIISIIIVQENDHEKYV